MKKVWYPASLYLAGPVGLSCHGMLRKQAFDRLVFLVKLVLSFISQVHKTRQMLCCQALSFKTKYLILSLSGSFLKALEGPLGTDLLF